MYKCDDKTQEESGSNTGNDFLMSGDFLGSTDDVADLAKVFETNAGQLGSGAGFGSRRFTRTQLTSVTKVKTADFTRVNRTTVITTRSWRGPSMDSFSIDQDRHGVAGFDLLNLMPTHRDSAQWISNADAFIEEGNFGIPQNGESKSADESTPCKCDNSSAPTLLPPVDSDVERAEKISRTYKEVSTRRTINFAVPHTAILSDSYVEVAQ